MLKKISIFFITVLFSLLTSSVSHSELSKVIRVVDGDTIVVDYQGQKEKVRLIGVDTPETVDPRRPVQAYGKEASDFSKKMLTGKKVRLAFDWNKRDKFGRVLAYINLPSDQVKDAPGCMVKSGNEFDFNASLISCGYGHAYTRFPFAKMEEHRELERKARTLKRGLWASEESSGKFSGSAGQKQETLVGIGFVASRDSSKFHRTTCQWAQKISSKNKVRFFSREEAVKAGYKPCGICKP